jgi:hypothetical protein
MLRDFQKINYPIYRVIRAYASGETNQYLSVRVASSSGEETPSSKSTRGKRVRYTAVTHPAF